MGEIKREQECTTADDWRHRAYHLESEWARCSQACAVMQAERDALTQKLKASEAEVAQIGSYCQTLTDAKVELAAELGEALAEVALRKSEVELFRDKLKARCDEVAKLSAAAAQMREALEAFDADQVPHDMALEMREAALSTDAGKDWIDATGAVKAKVLRQTAFGNAWLEWTPMPADWAGASVLIIPKPKE